MKSIFKEETKICTDCKGEFPLSYFPYNKRKCDPCFKLNRKIVRQVLAERNGCKNYKQYLKLKTIQKLYGSNKNNYSY